MAEEVTNKSALVLADQSLAGTSSGAAPSPSSSSAPREYRKGNWTLHETLVLISAKKMDEERRTKGGGERDKSRNAEFRWKWVENYCWKNGCLRSQNQCNDKWDNLLRDYKKVREFEVKITADRPSYWRMEKHERKEMNLPSNLVLEVFQALTEVVSKRYQQRAAVTAATPEKNSGTGQPLPPPVLQHQPSLFPHLRPPPPPLPTLPLPPPLPPAPPVSADMSDSSDTEGSERLDSSEAKRRKRVGSSLGSSIVQSASVLAETLLACEEKKDKRHKEVLEMEERKLRMEENRTEMSRQGIAGLIAAVNNLSGAIHALVSDRNEAT